MFSLLEELFLLILSDKDFFALDAPDESIAKAIASSVAVDTFIDALPFDSSKDRVIVPDFIKQIPELDSVSENAIKKNSDGVLVFYNLALAKSKEIESRTIKHLLDRAILRQTRQFRFFGSPVLKIAKKEAVRELRSKINGCIVGGCVPTEHIAALVWILQKSGLLRIAISYRQSCKYKARIEEISQNFNFPLSI